jgi:anthranilate synthase component 2
MTGPRLLLVDNLDSFSFMLADYLRSAGANVDVVRSNELSLDDALTLDVDGFVISPGPGTADEAGISVELANACIQLRRPLLGVCLGHQAIARACGLAVERTDPVHGKTASIRHDGEGLFDGLPSPMRVTRYHSLAVTVVQFHPESIASEYGHGLIANFLRIVRAEA